MAKWQKRLAQIEREADIKKVKKEFSEPTPRIYYETPIINVRGEEIEKFAMSCFEGSYERPERISVSLYEDSCTIDFKRFSNEPNISFDFLVKFSEYFKTKKINIPSVDQDSSGCATCGHGARWSFSLEIKEFQLPE